MFLYDGKDIIGQDIRAKPNNPIQNQTQRPQSKGRPKKGKTPDPHHSSSRSRSANGMTRIRTRTAKARSTELLIWSLRSMTSSLFQANRSEWHRFPILFFNQPEICVTSCQLPYDPFHILAGFLVYGEIRNKCPSMVNLPRIGTILWPRGKSTRAKCAKKSNKGADSYGNFIRKESPLPFAFFSFLLQ